MLRLPTPQQVIVDVTVSLGDCTVASRGNMVKLQVAVTAKA